MSIDTETYIVRSTLEIEKLAASVLDADQNAQGGRSTFLRALVATTQAELQSPPRVRNGQPARLDAAETKAHLAAFEAVYGRFLEAVNKVAKATVPDPDVAMMRQRTAFARSAGSTVRGYIRAGQDIRVLAAHKVVKAFLATPTAKRKFSVDALQNQAATAGETLKRVARNLYAADSDIARAAIEPILAQIAKLAGLTDGAVKDARKAVSERVPLMTRTGVFLPLDFAAAKAARKAA